MEPGYDPQLIELKARVNDAASRLEAIDTRRHATGLSIEESIKLDREYLVEQQALIAARRDYEEALRQTLETVAG